MLKKAARHRAPSPRPKVRMPSIRAKEVLPDGRIIDTALPVTSIMRWHELILKEMHILLREIRKIDPTVGSITVGDLEFEGRHVHVPDKKPYKPRPVKPVLITHAAPEAKA